MRITEKFKNKCNDIHRNRQPVIAFSGDSVTQGCFEVYVKEGNVVETVFNSSESYSEKVKKIFATLYPSANLTIINTGISGNTAEGGNIRLEEDVISAKPDLAVVCYGLNDANQREAGLEKYRESLRAIFQKLRSNNIEVIFMTPNMCSDKVDFSIKEPEIAAAAKRVADTVNGGWLDTYIDNAKQICAEENIPVCDCYNIWKNLKNAGVDITSVLANKINHPTEKLHWLFAYELVKTMIEK